MMPTNRRRKVRQSNRIPTQITDAYKEDLTIRDFLGELSEDEIPLAKQLGLYCWDSMMKTDTEDKHYAKQ